jgi:hypothetical protein
MRDLLPTAEQYAAFARQLEIKAEQATDPVEKAQFAWQASRWRQLAAARIPGAPKENRFPRRSAAKKSA